MKRLLPAVALLTVLAACGDDDSAATPPAPSTEVSATAATIPATTSPTSEPPAETAVPWPTDLIAPDAVLAFQSSDSVHLATADGVPIVDEIPGAEGGQEGPDWSSDGTQLTFHTDWATVWVADADGANARAVYECAAPCVFLQDPSFTPDGTSVVFIQFNAVDDVATGGQIVSVDIMSGEPTVLYADDTGYKSHYSPRVSPDGNRLVFEEDTWASQSPDEQNTTAVNLVVVDLASGAPTVLFEAEPGQSLHPDWSPDGSRIVFTRDDANLWTTAPDGSDLAALTTFDGAIERAIQGTYTPGGEAVVFVHESEPGNPQTARAAVIATDGTGFALIGPDAPVTHPRIRP